MEGSQVFKNLFTQSSTAYKSLRKIAISPETTKRLRTWNRTEVASLVNKTPQTLRNLEEQNKIRKPSVIKKGTRTDRAYTLEDVNQLREYFKLQKRKPENSDPAIFCFVNFKGGAGKTTSAVNAAQFFALKGYRILLIDCDSQGSATHMFGHIPDEDFSEKETLLDVLTAVEPLPKNQVKALVKKTYWDGLDLIPANLSLYNAEFILPTQVAKATLEKKPIDFYNRLNIALRHIYNDYDMIILDCPPSMGMISINALYASNILTIGMPPVVVDFASTTQFFKMAGEVLERLPKKTYSAINLLITKHNNRKNATEIFDVLKMFLGEHLMAEYMIETEAIKTASSSMQTLYEVDKNISNKKTYDRALHQANLVNESLEKIAKKMWQQDNEVGTKTKRFDEFIA